jgi:uncharacterized protein (DUF608 family)
VCGVVYRLQDTVTNGMALGGVDTGCIDLETSGLLGYCTIFNTHVPRRGPINLPLLGLSVGGSTWVLCNPAQVKQGYGLHQQDHPAENPDLRLDGVRTPRQIHYWGHYPVVDLEFETDAPVSVGLRAWSPFLPGDVETSMIPGIVFEVHIRNTSKSLQQGAVAFSFPGPTPREAGTDTFVRKQIKGRCTGVSVAGKLASYALGVISKETPRLGGELGAHGAAWAKMATALPAVSGTGPGGSVAVDFALEPDAARIVRFVLTWSSPTWNSMGYHGATSAAKGYSAEPRSFSHMYAKYYPSADKTAALLARSHASLLKRVLAWQQVIYAENKLPVWLRDSLVNVLYMITEDGLWAQAKPPIPDWVEPDEGLFGMNECPRWCPQIECIPCSFYGSLPLAYFFPELELSTLRGYKGYQFEDGAPTWIFGGCTGQTPYIDFASPTRGYQFASNGISLAALVDRFLMCHDTPDGRFLHEFYPMVKRNMAYTAGLRTTPSYSIGERIISMPDGNAGTEWIEADEPGWCGMTAHIGGLHLAQLRIVERMAQRAGDAEFADECAKWVAAAQEAMEKRLWTGSYYLNYWEPETDRKSDFVFGFQLDGEWIVAHHGLPGTLPKERVRTTLETIKRCNVALGRHGTVNYTNPDGTPIRQATPGTWDYGTYSYFPPEALMLAMTYIYNGAPEFGIEIARRVWHNLVCAHGYTWDMPVIMRGDADTGESSDGTDYYQDMMLWSLPAALAGQDLAGPCQPDGLVARVLRAARGLGGP